MLMELRLEFRHDLLAACINLKKALDSVHYGVFCDLLRISEIPAKIVYMMTGLFSGTEKSLKYEGIRF